MAAVEPMPVMKIIYNDCYGSFCFSADFLAEYKARTGATIRAYIDTLPGPHSVRCDPAAVALLEERGTEWSSGPGAYLSVYKLPTIFKDCWEIDEYDGNETVRVNFANAYANLAHVFMKTGDHEGFVKSYRALDEARLQIHEMNEAREVGIDVEVKAELEADA